VGGGEEAARDCCNKLTDASAVEHEISCFAVAQTPENRHGTERGGSDDDIANTGRPLGDHMVVSSRDPQMGVGDGRPPESERIRNPVGEEQACSRHD